MVWQGPEYTVELELLFGIHIIAFLLCVQFFQNTAKLETK